MTTRRDTRPDQSIALITGANRGLGRATAERLAQAGACVIIGARDDAAGARAASELRDLGLDSDHVLLDVTDPDCLTRETAATLVDLQLLRATFGTNLFGAAATVMEAAAFIADVATGSHDLTSGSFADAQGPVPW